MKNLKKYILIFSIMLILMASCGLVSASSDTGDDNSISADITDMEITDSSQTVDLIETGESTNSTSDDSLDSKNLNDKVKTNSKASTPVTGNTFQDIQDAIDNANEGDTLELSGTYYGNGTNITINKQLTIQGDSSTILDSKGLSGVFDIQYANNLVLKNLTFKNTINNAIYVNGYNSIVYGCSFINCTSYEDYHGGGAVYWYGDYGSLSACSFVNCSSYSSGGSVYWYGDYGSLSACSFVNCSSYSKYEYFYGVGGAVYWVGAYGNIFNSSFNNNNAYLGEDVYWSTDSGKLANCSFASYNANSIYASDGILIENITQDIYKTLTDLKKLIDDSIDEITLQHDYAFIYGDNKSGILIDKNIKINGNGKVIDGMGVSSIFNISKNGSLSAKNLFFNQSPFAIYSEGKLNVSNSIFKHNYVYNTGQKYFNTTCIHSLNEIYLNDCRFSIKDYYYSINDIFVNGTGIITNCNFTNNKNSFHDEESIPSACLAMYGSVSLLNSSFINNEGGLLYSTDNTIIKNCKFLDNIGDDLDLISLNGQSSISNCSFINNSGEQYNFNHGDIVSVFGSNNILDCTFINCSSNRRGGVISLKKSDSYYEENIYGNVLIHNCSFINCSSKISGGAVYLDAYSDHYPTLTIEDSTFINNTAEENGGAICISKSAYYDTYGICNVLNSKFLNNKVKGIGDDIYNEGNLSLFKNNLTNDFATIYNANYKNGSLITSPVSLVILDNSTRTAYKGSPFTLYAKLVDDNGNLIEDDRISLNIGSERKTVFFNEKNGLYEYTLNNVEEPILVSGSYDGTTDLTVKTGYIAFSNQSGGGEIVPVIANGTIDFITNEESVAIILKDLDEKPISNGLLSVNLNGVSSTLLTNTNGQANIVVNGNSTLKVVYTDSNGATVSASIVIKETEKIIEKNNTVEVPVYINRTVEVPVYINNTVEKNNTVYVNVTPKRTNARIIYQDMVTTAVAPADGRIGEYFEVTLVDANGKALVDKNVSIGFNGKMYNRTTNATGGVKLQINLAKVDKYTFAIAFLGDDDYTGSFEVALITVNPQVPKLTASAKSFKASAKTKSISATFKTANGNAVSGKQISFTVNGKTYTAKTNSKGVATVKISLNKKGTYSAVAKFAGDTSFKATSTKFNVKIT